MTKEQTSWMLKGAHVMRKYILAKMRRMDWTVPDANWDLEQWIKDASPRFNKRKGGLGK